MLCCCSGAVLHHCTAAVQSAAVDGVSIALQVQQAKEQAHTKVEQVEVSSAAQRL
jgi:hypothetical protein